MCRLQWVSFGCAHIHVCAFYSSFERLDVGEVREFDWWQSRCIFWEWFSMYSVFIYYWFGSSECYMWLVYIDHLFESGGKKCSSHDPAPLILCLTCIVVWYTTYKGWNIDSFLTYCLFKRHTFPHPHHYVKLFNQGFERSRGLWFLSSKFLLVTQH